MVRHDQHCGNGSLKTRVRQIRAAVLKVATCALLALPASAQAGRITISWDPNPSPEVVGYRIHNAPDGQPFAAPIEVGNVLSHTLTGLDDAIAYHAAVTAYDSLGQESPLSAEVVYNPRSEGGGDADGDGLPDQLEASGCTSPTDADTDDDGLADGSEDADRDGVRDAAETSACAADTDGDGLQDGTELAVTVSLASADTDPVVFRPDLDPASATDPLNPDTDGDGLADGREDLDANGRVDAGETDPRIADNPLLFADSFADGTKAGDPSWRRIAGTWSVLGAAKRFTSSSAPANIALIADPGVRELRSGRIESWVSLTRTFSQEPNAQIIFHYLDASHFRYVRLSSTGLSIGQVGSSPVEQAGVRASLKRSHKLNTGYQLRVDIEDGTTVRVYLNGSANPVLSHRFVVNSSGRVGYRTEGAKSLFDNAAVWTDFVLQ